MVSPVSDERCLAQPCCNTSAPTASSFNGGSTKFGTQVGNYIMDMRGQKWLPMIIMEILQ